MYTPRHGEWLLYSSLCFVADILDDIGSFFAPAKQREANPKVRFSTQATHKPELATKDGQCGQHPDVDAMSDEDILGTMRNTPRLDSISAVFHLTAGTVAKVCSTLANEPNNDCSEAIILNTLFAQTNIPVPRIRRVIKSTWSHVIVMDYIKGRTLAEVWTSYSLWRKISTALTLRRYVRQLHRIKASHKTPPGPLSAYGPRKCYASSIFGSLKPIRGPFSSYEEFSAFLNARHDMGFKSGSSLFHDDDPDRYDKFDDSSPLVIVHSDLNPRNIIAGDDGRLWLIDWGWSGFYPSWFELVAMTKQVENERYGGWYDRFWTLMVPFVCGPYFKQQTWFSKVQAGLYYT